MKKTLTTRRRLLALAPTAGGIAVSALAPGSWHYLSWPLFMLAFWLLGWYRHLLPSSWRSRKQFRSWKRHGRPPISQAVRLHVLRRDVVCVYCGSDRRLQVDHVRPWSQGGRSVPGNLVVLCALHNRYKSDYWPWPERGWPYPSPVYHPFPGYDDIGMARRILDAGLEHLRRLGVAV